MSLANYLKGIANAIRERKGTNETINAQNFAEEIRNLPEKFSIRLDDESSEREIASLIVSLPPIDFKNITTVKWNLSGLSLVEEISVKNTESLIDIEYLFYGNESMKSVKGLVTSNVKNIANCFGSCVSLQTLSKLQADNIEIIDSVFTTCYGLENFGGFENLGKVFDRENSFAGNIHLNLTECSLLTHDSLMNIINNLYDVASVINASDAKAALLLNSESKSKLTAEEIAIAEIKGWIVA